MRTLLGEGGVGCRFENAASTFAGTPDAGPEGLKPPGWSRMMAVRLKPHPFKAGYPFKARYKFGLSAVS